ncbi:hypothetical protein NP233_g665 [Leucocoprinus birnbaumii]|uniref:F-box domain-containing protein n=1 Tax=Leucocoprinus birnbaumii TaxID=56174 RepID=A0AAD5W1X2_9AGAR|nr:hypothetical protein NP233_g665 [Leucocoprinus birnbaumii]
MTSLDLLPDEILRKVFQNFTAVTEEDRKWLCDSRFVSRSFNDLIVPILFAEESHMPEHMQLPKCLAKISVVCRAMEAHAPDNDKHQISTWADTFIRDIGARSTLTELKLKILAVPPHSGFSLEPISNLTTVEIYWDIFATDKGCDPERWQRQSTSFMSQVSELLKRCPDLQSFTFLSEYFSTERSLAPITLASLLDRLQSPSTPSRKLRRLVTRAVIVHVDDIRSNLHHLHHLEELVLEANPDPSAFTHFGDICAMLQMNDIKVKSLFIEDLQHSGISQYIASYQGLEKLVLREFDRINDSPVIIGGFIASLQNHCKTLKWLEFDVDRLSPWPQGIVAHLQSEAEQYVALQTLRIRLCITLDDANNVEGRILTELLETAMRLQALRLLECSSVNFKTGSGMREDYIELRWGVNSPSRIHTFMERIVEHFKRDREPKFAIKLFKD